MISFVAGSPEIKKLWGTMAREEISESSQVFKNMGLTVQHCLHISLHHRIFKLGTSSHIFCSAIGLSTLLHAFLIMYEFH